VENHTPVIRGYAAGQIAASDRTGSGAVPCTRHRAVKLGCVVAARPRIGTTGAGYAPAMDDERRDDDGMAESGRPSDEKMYTGETLDTPEGPRTPRQMNVGPGNEQGGGEWPDPRTPAQAPAPGAASAGERDVEEESPD